MKQKPASQWMRASFWSCMAYDEGLADRVRAALTSVQDVTEQPMFGGLTFLHQGNMACGVLKADLVVRMSPEGAAEAIGRSEATHMLLTGRPLKGIITIPGRDVATREDVQIWVDRAIKFTSTLPPKFKAGPRRPRRGTHD